jgi:hypothetical protein
MNCTPWTHFCIRILLDGLAWLELHREETEMREELETGGYKHRQSGFATLMIQSDLDNNGREFDNKSGNCRQFD